MSSSINISKRPRQHNQPSQLRTTHLPRHQLCRNECPLFMVHNAHNTTQLVHRDCDYRTTTTTVALYLFHIITPSDIKAAKKLTYIFPMLPCSFLHCYVLSPTEAKWKWTQEIYRLMRRLYHYTCLLNYSAAQMLPFWLPLFTIIFQKFKLSRTPLHISA